MNATGINKWARDMAYSMSSVDASKFQHKGSKAFNGLGEHWYEYTWGNLIRKCFSAYNAKYEISTSQLTHDIVRAMIDALVTTCKQRIENDTTSRTD